VKGHKDQRAGARGKVQREHAEEVPQKPDGQAGLFRLYGRQPIFEAARRGLLKSLEVSRLAHGRIIEEILHIAQEQRVPVERVEHIEPEAGHPVQGIRALAQPPQLRFDLAEFVRKLPPEPPPLLLMVDGVTDPQNFGAILRTAEAAGVQAVIVRERRQAPITEAVVKTSAGAAYLIPLFQVVNLAQTLRMLADKGIWSVAAVLDVKALRYDRFDWRRPTVVIVGAEGPGVADLLVRKADDCVYIPMSGRIDSLNVSVATGILLFEAAKARTARK
jgi:23S rRNA (guanosine2251-2'-O)-methyltransferase